MEVILRIKNSAMDNYDIEMWRYSQELKRASANPLLGHEQLPNRAATLQGVVIRTNDWGLRGGAISDVSESKRRILVLGSSITLGWGVAESDTFTIQLQTLFEDGGQQVEVLNGGIGNYNTVRYVEWFLTRLTEIEPTDIVIHYFINDAEKLESGGGNLLLRHSQLAVTGWTVANRFLRPTGSDSLANHYRTVYAEDAEGYVEMIAALRRLKIYADQNSVRLYMALVPDIHNLVDYPFNFIHSRMKDLGTQLGIHVVDLLPALRGVEPEQLWAMPGDPHANALGHRLMAKTMYSVLKK